MIEQGIPAKAAAAASLDEIAALLQSFPRIGDFKAGQFAFDLNYVRTSAYPLAILSSPVRAHAMVLTVVLRRTGNDTTR